MTVTDPFSTPSEVPSGGNGFDMKEQVGKLLVIKPTDYKTGITTKFGTDKDCVVADITVVNEATPASSETFADTWIMQGRLIGKLKGLAGSGHSMLARVTQVPTDRGNPAYDLADPSPADRNAAKAWYEATQAPPF